MRVLRVRMLASQSFNAHSVAKRFIHCLGYGRARNAKSFVSNARSSGGKSTKESKCLPGLWGEVKPLEDTVDTPHADVWC
jgi:hypothetical protein